MTNEYENLPYFLKTQKRWVLWKKKEISDSNGVIKTTKLPIDAHTGYVASTTNEDTWCDFETAMKGYEYYKTEGIGYVLGAGVVGIDIDHSFLNYKKELTQYGYQVGKISLKEKTVIFNKIV